MNHQSSFSYSSPATSPRPYRSAPCSLATELDFVFDNDESDNSIRDIAALQQQDKQANHLRVDSSATVASFVSQPSDYSGDEYGHPEDDDDPDGLFNNMNEIVENLMSCMNYDVDSAYMSDEEAYTPARLIMTEHDTACVSSGGLVDALRTLPGQGALEANIKRLIKTYDSTAWSLEIRSNELRELCASVLGFLAPTMEDEEIEDDLTGRLTSLSKNLPRPQPDASLRVRSLRLESQDLLIRLAHLTDALQETRQFSNQASRALRASKDACHQWQADIETVRLSTDWLTQNSWETKLIQRTTSKELASIRRGFEDFCNELGNEIAARG